MTRFLARSFSLLVTLAMVALAVPVALGLWDYYMEAPWTRDGRLRADIVAVAPDVSGLVTQVLVEDNQQVKRGDVLFRIDPDRFTLALRQAEAQVAGKKAMLDQAAADDARYKQLSDKVISEQKLESVQATSQQAKAAYDESLADRDIAKLNLTRSEVRAPVNGRITNVDLQPGTYVSVGHGVMALVDSDTLRVEGYFEETKLPRIHVGDPVAIHLMGEPAALHGHVSSIASGIEDRERSEGATLLANVNPTFTWVRLAQRVPVRVELDGVPEDVRLVVGRTATVSVEAADGKRGPDLMAAWRRVTALMTGKAS
ncbi:HlyD family secretion protein [Beijerinckia sp. L45]|uniref:efflux RND transporter periplasmic adaptor subunit n=1 Tax=Beijerinckia sp. L45 TaxID=1641855 RepID=UPI00131B7EA6|nr:HlyD family secretion protein [Beijerinckia sp. L45]